MTESQRPSVPAGGGAQQQAPQSMTASALPPSNPGADGKPWLVLTRPADENPRSAAAFEAAGFGVLSAPLLTIEAMDCGLTEADLISLDGRPAFEALLFTSPRAPALWAQRFPQTRSWPTAAVGGRTAEAAQAAGFNLALVGETDGNAIIRQMRAAGYRHVLKPCALEAIPLVVPSDLQLVEAPIYKVSQSTFLPADVVTLLRSDKGPYKPVVTLFSPRSARVMVDLLAFHAISPQNVDLVALSANVAKAAGDGWAEVQVADQPNLADSIAAAGRLQQMRGLWPLVAG